jgi:UDP-N-acetylglucosamine/UDP-N-acetylgalactosamine diphosphorylase
VAIVWNDAELRRLYQYAQQPEQTLQLDGVRSPVIIRIPTTPVEHHQESQARLHGEAELRKSTVAVILVAGGQGTRLGHDAPKGTYPIGPVTQRSLFQIHAEKVLALQRRYKCRLPLLIMTSDENDCATREFFLQHRYFGLAPEGVTFFMQGMLPALDMGTGAMLMKSEHEFALSPNGHGGLIQALHEGGHLNRLAQDGIQHCFYFQVDNPLVNIADPVFLGYHLAPETEMSLKVVAKLHAHERMGCLVELNGRCRMIEYTELPKDLAESMTADGQLKLWAGSPAIHFFNIEFLQKLGRGDITLPYHVARKAVPFWTPAGVVKPVSPNAFKFERFVFDAIPLAERVSVMEVSRKEEFEPLKNAEGDNSPATVRLALSDYYKRWLRSQGKTEPEGLVELSPLDM